MIQRATNPNDPQTKDYMGRGITLCGGLRKFTGFYATLGNRPKGKILDRWPNNDGNYSCGKCAECVQNGWPLNVRWATYSESNKNKRGTRILEVRGVTACFRDLAKHFNIAEQTVFGRLRLGWSVERAFTEPVKQRI